MFTRLYDQEYFYKEHEHVTQYCGTANEMFGFTVKEMAISLYFNGIQFVFNVELLN